MSARCNTLNVIKRRKHAERETKERRTKEHPQSCECRKKETHDCALTQSDQDRIGEAGSEGRKREAQAEGGVTV